MPRRNIIVPLVIAANVVVFLLWSYLSEEFMTDNFVVSWVALSQGRYWTLLTSEFSHNILIHLVFNMMVLSSFGSLLENVLGKISFIKLYISAALVASLAHCLVSVGIGEPEMGAVGASGALAGLVLVFALMFPKEKMLLFFFIPMPAWLGALAFVGLDIWGLVAQAEGGGLPIGHGAHLGGALAGLIYYFLFIRESWQQEKHHWV